MLSKMHIRRISRDSSLYCIILHHPAIHESCHIIAFDTFILCNTSPRLPPFYDVLEHKTSPGDSNMGLCHTKPVIIRLFVSRIMARCGSMRRHQFLVGRSIGCGVKITTDDVGGRSGTSKDLLPSHLRTPPSCFLILVDVSRVHGRG